MHRLLAIILGAVAAILAGPALALEFSTVKGQGDVPLVVVQTGNKQGPAILFIHGYSQSYLSWEKQLNDPALQKDFHLIAFDLRGHGASAKPSDPKDYTSVAWGGDVAAVIAATGNRRPVLVPWSYGGPVTMSYVRHHGVGDIAGINFVAAGTGLGEANPPPDMNDPAVKERMGRFMAMTSPDIAANLAATTWFVGGLTAKPLPAAEAETILIYNMLTPGYVRAAMFQFQPNNADLKGKITVPVLITHGDADGIVPHQISVDNAMLMPGSTLSTYKGIGHAPFLEDPARFNTELAAFVKTANGR
ncbi:MAG: alpha/beta hydrolase [Rhodospirillaceae bacterium]|nr:alpha/beta hydrolase [Rhodospirillaceae bacterium]